MATTTFALVAAFLLAYGLVSGRIVRTPITPPMVFVSFGLLCGPVAMGLIQLDVESEIIRTLAEATLVLVLFTDASRIDLSLLCKHFHLPLRLLAIGMPLTILLGAVLAALLFEFLTLWEAALVAAILAPTDAALGQAVVSSKQVPVRIRQGLNVESGLNDGIALPVVMIFVSLAGSPGEESASSWASFAALQVILGPLTGFVVAYAGGRLAAWGARTGWMDHSFQQLAALALSFLAFGAAELIGGNGFIAAFVAGLTIGNSSRQICGCLYDFAEAEGQFLALLAFLVFGAADIWPALAQMESSYVLYALLSLTVVRMAPVALSLVGSGLHLRSYLFLGWFGPRGLASILFVFLVMEGAGIAAKEQIFQIVTVTVLFSIFAHGLTAVPGAGLYARFIARSKTQEPHRPEHAVVPEMPTRLGAMD